MKYRIRHKKDSGGQSPVFPDVCKTPAPPAPPVPIPYPNLAESSDASDTATSVEADGQKIMLKKSVFSTSTGAMAKGGWQIKKRIKPSITSRLAGRYAAVKEQLAPNRPTMPLDEAVQVYKKWRERQ